MPVFVLTHHARPPLEMEGGTIFHFVTGGIEEALDRAREAAGERDVRIGGGASTIRQYLEARLIDEMHYRDLAGAARRGEALFAGLDLPALGYEVREHVASDKARARRSCAGMMSDVIGAGPVAECRPHPSIRDAREISLLTEAGATGAGLAVL